MNKDEIEAMGKFFRQAFDMSNGSSPDVKYEMTQKAKDTFKEMDKRGMIDLRVLEDGVGCEKFAELIGNYLQEVVHKETDGRVKVHKCQVWEHEDNMAEYYV